MYEVTFCMQELGGFPSFKDAFKELYKKVKGTNEPLSEMLLIEGTWIKNTMEPIPISLYNSIEQAHKDGLLTPDGKLTY